MKRYYFLAPVIMVLTGVFFTACTNSSPLSTLKKYLHAVKNDNNKKAYYLLSNKDRQEITFDNYINTHETVLSRYIKQTMDFSYGPVRFSETKNVAVIPVEINQIDVEKIFSEYPLLLDENMTDEKRVKYIKRHKHSLTYFTKTKHKEYKLVKENDEWFIDADFGKQEKINQIEYTISELQKEGKYEQTIPYYEQLLLFNPQNAEAYEEMMATESKINIIANDLILEKSFLESSVLIRITSNCKYRISFLSVKISWVKEDVHLEKDIVLVDKNDPQKQSYLGYTESLEEKIIIPDIDHIKNTVTVKIKRCDF